VHRDGVAPGAHEPRARGRAPRRSCDTGSDPLFERAACAEVGVAQVDRKDDATRHDVDLIGLCPDLTDGRDGGLPSERAIDSTACTIAAAPARASRRKSIGVVPAWSGAAGTASSRCAVPTIALTTAAARWQSRGRPPARCAARRRCRYRRVPRSALSQDRARARASPRPSRRPENRSRRQSRAIPEVGGEARALFLTDRDHLERAARLALRLEQGFRPRSAGDDARRRRAAAAPDGVECATRSRSLAFFRPVQSSPEVADRVPSSLEPNTFHPAFDARAASAHAVRRAVDKPHRQARRRSCRARRAAARAARPPVIRMRSVRFDSCPTPVLQRPDRRRRPSSSHNRPDHFAAECFAEVRADTAARPSASASSVHLFLGIDQRESHRRRPATSPASSLAYPRKWAPRGRRRCDFALVDPQKHGHSTLTRSRRAAVSARTSAKHSRASDQAIVRGRTVFVAISRCSTGVGTTCQPNAPHAN